MKLSTRMLRSSRMMAPLTGMGVMRMEPVATIAIKMPGNHGFWRCSIFVISLMAVLTWAGFGHADNKLGIVKKNTFVLSDGPSVKLEGSYVYGLVGYLPIGTHIWWDSKSIHVNNLTKGHSETYYRVNSSIGVSGLIRDDMFIEVNNRPIAVVVSSNQIWLHNPKIDERLMQIGRYDPAYIELSEKEDGQYLHGYLRRINPPNNLPATEPVRLWKEYVKNNSVTIVDPAAKGSNASVPTWRRNSSFSKAVTNKLIAKAQEKLSGQIDKIKSFFDDIDSIQCRTKISGSVELGYKILNNGLGFELNTDIKDPNQIFRMQRRNLYINGKEKMYLILQNIKCDGGIPERLQQLTIQEGVFDPKKRESVRLKDWQKTGDAKWTTSLAGRKKPFRMIQISNENEYQKAIRKLSDFVRSGKSFIRELPPEEGNILLNMILQELALFEHRDIIVKPN